MVCENFISIGYGSVYVLVKYQNNISTFNTILDIDFDILVLVIITNNTPFKNLILISFFYDISFNFKSVIAKGGIVISWGNFAGWFCYSQDPDTK